VAKASVRVSHPRRDGEAGKPQGKLNPSIKGETRRRLRNNRRWAKKATWDLGNDNLRLRKAGPNVSIEALLLPGLLARKGNVFRSTLPFPPGRKKRQVYDLVAKAEWREMVDQGT